MACPIMPGEAVIDGGTRRAFGRIGKVASTQIRTIMAKMVVPARCRKIWPRCRTPRSTLRASGVL